SPWTTVHLAWFITVLALIFHFFFLKFTGNQTNAKRIINNTIEPVIRYVNISLSKKPILKDLPNPTIIKKRKSS
ncbi:MAG TPA: hypothetical protein QF874_02245, partial [Pelagibacteraceae bacterium]|nr:hypothetical protein [Pelagibacteraceae bacterium]